MAFELPNMVYRSKEAREFAEKLSESGRLIFRMYLMIDRDTLQIKQRYNEKFVEDWIYEAGRVLDKEYDSYGR